MGLSHNRLYGALIVATIFSPQGAADTLTEQLKSILPSQKDMTFVQHESIKVPSRNAMTEEKYMLLDYKLAANKPMSHQQLQSSIHTICSKVLRNRDLVMTLTSQGYDMVSVSFDKKYQYDCL
jgi:hypothetical protein